jgi:hypothetical protein
MRKLFESENQPVSAQTGRGPALTTNKSIDFAMFSCANSLNMKINQFQRKPALTTSKSIDFATCPMHTHFARENQPVLAPTGPYHEQKH